MHEVPMPHAVGRFRSKRQSEVVRFLRSFSIPRASLREDIPAREIRFFSRKSRSPVAKRSAFDNITVQSSVHLDFSSKVKQKKN